MCQKVVILFIFLVIIIFLGMLWQQKPIEHYTVVNEDIEKRINGIKCRNSILPYYDPRCLQFWRDNYTVQQEILDNVVGFMVKVRPTVRNFMKENKKTGGYIWPIKDQIIQKVYPVCLWYDKITKMYNYYLKMKDLYMGKNNYKIVQIPYYQKLENNQKINIPTLGVYKFVEYEKVRYDYPKECCDGKVLEQDLPYALNDAENDLMIQIGILRLIKNKSFSRSKRLDNLKVYINSQNKLLARSSYGAFIPISQDLVHKSLVYMPSLSRMYVFEKLEETADEILKNRNIL